MDNSSLFELLFQHRLLSYTWFCLTMNTSCLIKCWPFITSLINWDISFLNKSKLSIQYFAVGLKHSGCPCLHASRIYVVRHIISCFCLKATKITILFVLVILLYHRDQTTVRNIDWKVCKIAKFQSSNTLSFLNLKYSQVSLRVIHWDWTLGNKWVKKKV